MIFVQSSEFVLHADLSKLKFVDKKRVHHDTYDCFWENLPTSEELLFQKRKVISAFSFHLFYNLKPAKTLGSLQCYDPLKRYF